MSIFKSRDAPPSILLAEHSVSVIWSWRTWVSVVGAEDDDVAGVNWLKFKTWTRLSTLEHRCRFSITALVAVKFSLPAESMISRARWRYSLAAGHRWQYGYASLNPIIVMTAFHKYWHDLLPKRIWYSATLRTFWCFPRGGAIRKLVLLQLIQGLWEIESLTSGVFSKSVG
jgi:hypothetical protein